MIKVLTKERLADLHTANQPFDIIGRLDITYKDGKWYSEEMLSDTVFKKQYPNYDGAEPSDYIDSNDRAAFLAYENGACVGQILIASAWNRYAHIEDISIARAWRGKGIGTSLMDAAVEWTKKKKLCGLSLECQNNNLLASRFYKKYGMHIGGVNTKLYRHMGKPYDKETAVFWYLDF